MKNTKRSTVYISQCMQNKPGHNLHVSQDREKVEGAITGHVARTNCTLEHRVVTL